MDWEGRRRREEGAGLDLNGVIRFVFVLFFALFCLFSCASPPKRKTKRNPKTSKTAFRSSPGRELPLLLLPLPLPSSSPSSPFPPSPVPSPPTRRRPRLPPSSSASSSSSSRGPLPVPLAVPIPVPLLLLLVRLLLLLVGISNLHQHGLARMQQPECPTRFTYRAMPTLKGIIVTLQSSFSSSSSSLWLRNPKTSMLVECLPLPPPPPLLKPFEAVFASASSIEAVLGLH